MLQGASLMLRQQRCDDRHITLAELAPLSTLVLVDQLVLCLHVFTRTLLQQSIFLTTITCVGLAKVHESHGSI